MERYQRGDLTFDVRDGGPQEGEAVVLLHGFPQFASSWSLVEPLLHAAGYRTLAPDQRGYSPGARPEKRSAYTSSELSADIIALLDAAGLKSAHVVGHDWGGAVAWALAGNHPDRIRSVTVLSTPHPAAMMKAWRTSTQAFRSWYMLAFQLPYVPEHLMPPVLVPMLRRSGLSKASAQQSASRLSDPQTLRCAINWYRALPYSAREPMHRPKVPTTYMWGRNDSFLGRKCAEITENYVLADYRFIEVDGGHWLPETHSGEVAAAIMERARSVAQG